MCLPSIDGLVLGGPIGFRNGSAAATGLGVSGGLAYGSLLRDVGDPKGSWAEEGLPLSSDIDLGDFPDSTRALRCEFEAMGRGLGVPTILAYGSPGEDGLDPDEPGENI